MPVARSPCDGDRGEARWRDESTGGAWLRSVRLAARLTQGQLSTASGVSVRTVRGLERGEILAEGDYAIVSADPRVRTAYMGSEA